MLLANPCRYDYGNASQICLWLQGGECINYRTNDFSNCALRCWGASYAPPTRFPKGWTYPKSQGLPQGKVFTFAGALGEPGFRDGPAGTALFHSPQGVAVDYYRNVYVADTGNHVIRMVSCAWAGCRGGRDGGSGSVVWQLLSTFACTCWFAFVVSLHAAVIVSAPLFITS